MSELRAKLSSFIRQVEEGESLYITRRGIRVAEIRPLERKKLPLTLGCAKSDDYHMAPDFDEPLEEMKEYT